MMILNGRRSPMPSLTRNGPMAGLVLLAAVAPVAAENPFAADPGAAIGRIVGTVNGEPASWTIRERADLMRESVADETHPGSVDVNLVAFREVSGEAVSGEALPETFLRLKLHVSIDPETRAYLGSSAAFVYVSSTDFGIFDEAYAAARPLVPFDVTRWEPEGGQVAFEAMLETVLEPQDNAFAASVIEAPGDLVLRLEIDVDLRFAAYDG
jgi:hypothetical protein